jgi:hypothetical protein
MRYEAMKMKSFEFNVHELAGSGAKGAAGS